MKNDPITEDAINDFMACCMEASKGSSRKFDRTIFDDFVEHAILPDPKIRACFHLTYPIARKYTKRDMDALIQLNKSSLFLAERFYAFHKVWEPYSNIMEEDFHKIRITLNKVNAGDKRPIAKIYDDSLPKEHEVTASKSITHYTLMRNVPVDLDYVLKNTCHETSYGKKWIAEIHIFGVSDKGKRDRQNIDNLLMLQRFSQPQEALPSKSQPERLIYYHPEVLPADSSWEDIEKICTIEGGTPLAWGPKFINLIYPLTKKASNLLGLDFEPKELGESYQMPTKYPTKYWLFMEKTNEIENIVSYHFLGTIKKLGEKPPSSIEAFTSWIETVFKRAVLKEIQRDIEKNKNQAIRLGSPKSLEDLSILEEALPAEDWSEGIITPEYVTFDSEDVLSNDEIYIAKNINEKTKTLAKRLGLSPRRIQQLKVQVVAKLEREAHKKQKYLALWLAEIKKIKMIIYRKPFYRYKQKK